MLSKKFKSSCIILLVLSLVVVAVGCTSSKNQTASTTTPAVANPSASSANTASPASTDPKDLIEITQLVWDRGMIKADQGTIQDNWWTKYVNDHMAKLGIKVKFVPVPRKEETVKLPTMLAAGEAPDLDYTYDKNLLNQYAKNNALVDYTDLLPKYGPNLLKLYNQADLNAIKINGKYIAFPDRGPFFPDTTWIRKDWLDILGLPEPKNLDEMYNILKQFKEKDPGKVGNKLIPLAMSGDFNLWDQLILPAFVKDPPTGEKLVTPVALWPETKDALRFMNKLYNEKLLGSFILDKDGSQFKQQIINGDIGAFLNFAHYPYHPAYGNILENLQKNNPNAKLVSTFPWQSQSKENFIEFNTSNGYFYRWYSPITAKHPIQVMQYLNWLSSEEVYTVNSMGIEGVDFNMVNGVPTVIDQAKFDTRVPWVGAQYGTTVELGVNDPSVSLKTTAQLFQEKYRNDYITKTLTPDKLKFSTPNLSELTPLADKNSAALIKQWNESVDKIVVASAADFDKVFDKEVAAYKAAGGTDVAAEAVSAYHKQYDGK